MSDAAKDTLNEKYSDTRRLFSKRSRLYKRRHQISWIVVWASVWLTLLLCILGLAVSELKDVHAFGLALDTIVRDHIIPFVLHYVIPSLGIVVAVFTALQVFFRFPVKWTSYRFATEHMNNVCMLYRAELPPFDDRGTADERLGRWIDKIESKAGTGKEFGFRYIFQALRLPPDVHEETESLPRKGISPKLGGNSAAGEKFDELAVIKGRLQDQRKYYILTARKYLLGFLSCQGLIILMSLVNIGYSWAFGRNLLVIALATTVSLAIIAWRDAGDYLQRAFQYLRSADELETVRNDYDNSESPFDPALGPKQRLQLLVREVENALRRELDGWYTRYG